MFSPAFRAFGLLAIAASGCSGANPAPLGTGANPAGSDAATPATSSDSGPTPSSGGSGAGSGSGTSSGAGSGSGMSGGAGSGSGMSGGDGSTPPDAGSGGADGAAAADGTVATDGGASGGFTCTLILGVSVVGEWFDEGGFLQVVDGARWESNWKQHEYTNLWVNPSDPVWTQGFSPYPPAQPHTCAQNSASPDRVIFVAVNWTYTTQAAWEGDLTKIVGNIQTKYPSVKQIELMTMLRAPGNALCAPNSSVETIVQPWVDAAIAAVAARSPSHVVAAPKLEVPNCVDFMGIGPHFTVPGRANVAQVVGAYYKAHP